METTSTVVFNFNSDKKREDPNQLKAREIGEKYEAILSKPGLTQTEKAKANRAFIAELNKAVGPGRLAAFMAEVKEYLTR